MIYLDNAATTDKKPESVYTATISAMVNASANAGRGAHKKAMAAAEILFNTRLLLSKLFNVKEPSRIAFTKNTTEGLNMAIKGVLGYGDHIIFSSMEHNSVLRPIKQCEKNLRVTSSVLRADKNGELNIDNLEGLIRKDTKLICLTHASNVCGNIYDIYRAAEIAKKHGVLLLIDAAQSAGTLGLDFEKFDMVAFPGHKGLMAPMGTGGLYVREGVPLKTIIEGGTGSLSEMYSQPEIMPDMLESGTQNVTAIAGLGAAAEFILNVGTDEIFKHESALNQYFENSVREMKNVHIYGAKNKTAVCSLNIDGIDCVTLSQILNDKFDIAVRSGLHCAVLAHESLETKKIGTVRFSFGYFNTINDAKCAVNAIYKISKGDF